MEASLLNFFCCWQIKWKNFTLWSQKLEILLIQNRMVLKDNRRYGSKKRVFFSCDQKAIYHIIFRFRDSFFKIIQRTWGPSSEMAISGEPKYWPTSPLLVARVFSNCKRMWPARAKVLSTMVAHFFYPNFWNWPAVKKVWPAWAVLMETIVCSFNGNTAFI